jgi:hypothetical protein
VRVGQLQKANVVDGSNTACKQTPARTAAALHACHHTLLLLLSSCSYHLSPLPLCAAANALKPQLHKQHGCQHYYQPHRRHIPDPAATGCSNPQCNGLQQQHDHCAVIRCGLEKVQRQHIHSTTTPAGPCACMPQKDSIRVHCQAGRTGDMHLLLWMLLISMGLRLASSSQLSYA